MDEKITQLAGAGVLTGAELVEVVRAGANLQTTVSAISQQAASTFNLVSLLLHMDGLNGSSVFTDSSSYGEVATPSGGLTLSTANPKFGTACGNFSGAGTLAVPMVARGPMDIWRGDCTFEMWINPTGTQGSGAAVFDMSNGATTGVYSVFQSGTNTVSLQGSGFGGSAFANATPLTPGVWHHLAFVRYGGLLGIFVDGIASWSSNVVGNMSGAVAGNMTIGNGWPFAGGFIGLIDELRITKGLCRYINDFTPPTAAFPNN
jgi:hypothetical protein